MLDYKLIEALAMVTQEGGFDKAAQTLFITQSAVSQRIKALEELTGQILIARTTPPRPTAAGKRLLKHYFQVKHLEDNLLTELGRQIEKRQTSIALAINADSLATWFLGAIQSFVQREEVLLDLRIDDQEQTHRLLKDGEVVGCISTKDRPLQGCRVEYLGTMTYQMMAAPHFAMKWFPNGLTLSDAASAPALLFNRKDELHRKLFQRAFGQLPEDIPASYIPSSERFADFIEMGLGYGMLPYQQSESSIKAGRLIDLAPGYHVPVHLYWHCWNLNSRLLDTFTENLKTSVAALFDS